MAEALTIIEVAAFITEVVDRLCTYVSAVRSAKDDIRKLTQELFALKGAMYQCNLHTKSDSFAPWQAQVQSMLALTNETLESIQKKLGTPTTSKVGQAIQSLTWPFKSDDVEQYLAAIERSKTWFIMILMRDSVDATATVLTEMQLLTAMVRQDILDKKTHQELEEIAELLKWLSPVNSRDKLRDSVADRVPGSGQWIHAGRFSAWEEGAPTNWPVFWIAGRSGSGKTVLFSHLVEKLQERIDSNASHSASKVGLGFHCCSLDDTASQAIPNVFGSILAQVAAVRPEILDHIRPLRQSGNTLIPQNNLSITQIHEVMDQALGLFDIFYLAIDALNENSHEALIIQILLDLCEKHANLRVLVTCTHEPVDASPKIYLRQMTTESIDSDIELYVKHRLSNERSFQTLRPEIQEEIRTKIVSDAHGTFRWAKVCMDRLSVLRTPRDVKRALQDMPSTLNETYAAILNRIPEQDKEIAREALTWLSFSLRPLGLEELAEAVVVEENDTDIDNDCRLNDSSIIPQICQDLVHVSKKTVTLAHDSIRTCLQSDWIRTSNASDFALDTTEGHRKIMRKCLAYLNFGPFTSGPVDKQRQIDSRFVKYPLLDYAATMWPIHSERFTMAEADERLILDFFETKKHSNGGPFESWVQYIMHTTNLNAIRNTEPLYYAVSYGMTSILKLLLKPEHKVDVNKKGGRFYSPPLFVAVWKGNVEDAKLLLRAGANPDAYDTIGQTSRRLAVSRDMDELVELIDELWPDKVWHTVALKAERRKKSERWERFKQDSARRRMESQQLRIEWVES
ncbi:Vegetative incompatibility protein HET-E-1 [Colletotrichum aenigma]|uniref:Vegetative incompatibility protein HET-E-1 n=1 Tax=Colletotrichum aenigma TaxID=1215731 RepID=UPI001872ADE4|nr:Vegetative incompatibility protein HET-E-1 [Colletotrichum aenigma]KAF5520555.1 Vegetative incompatibility protein HET-E-1 [Colletotrichum aenigma]